MKIYIAARYNRKEEMKGVAARLRTAGHKVASMWMYETYEANVTLNQVPQEILREIALSDYIELGAADAVLMFSEDPLVGTPRGGRHVEFGIAIGMGKDIYVIGPKENIFHYLPLPGINHFESLEEVLDAIHKS